MLTRQQQASLRNLQTSSFNEYCVANGYEPTERAELIFGQLKTKFDQAYGTWDIDKFDGPVGKTLRAFRDAHNFFEIKDAANDFRKIQTAQVLSGHKDPPPISDVYLAKLRRIFGLPNGSLEEILVSIPVIPNWSPEFNAFVSDTSSIEGLPCICMNEALLTGCEAFIDSIAPVALDFGESIDARAVPECELIGSTDHFMTRLHSILECCMGRLDHAIADHDEGKRKANLTYTVMVMIEGGIQMVWFHEIGHLLQGHLELPQSQAVEFSADRFAVSLVAATTTDKSLNILAGIGALTTLVLLDIIEMIHRWTEGPIYPWAKRRLNAAMQTLDIDNPEIAGFARRYLPSVAAACNPTLQRNWGVSITYSEG